MRKLISQVVPLLQVGTVVDLAFESCCLDLIIVLIASHIKDQHYSSYVLLLHKRLARSLCVHT